MIEVFIVYKHILVPSDGSERSSRAIKAGLHLAKTLNARLTGLFVSEPTYIHEVDTLENPRAKEVLAAISQQAEMLGVSYGVIEVKAATPQDGIVCYAKENACDLIIMGTHGRSRVGKLLLGSAAASVLAECEIPVMLYR